MSKTDGPPVVKVPITHSNKFLRRQTIHYPKLRILQDTEQCVDESTICTHMFSWSMLYHSKSQSLAFIVDVHTYATTARRVLNRRIVPTNLLHGRGMYLTLPFGDRSKPFMPYRFNCSVVSVKSCDMSRYCSLPSKDAILLFAAPDEQLRRRLEV
jgi:hypothetical protein